MSKDRTIYDCKLEAVVEAALSSSGLEFVRHDDKYPHLDFYLPKHDLFIEVKQFHSDWIGLQLRRAPNVIVLQGEKAVMTFVGLLSLFTMNKELLPILVVKQDPIGLT